MANKWLTSTVDTYLKHFGIKINPIVYDVGSRDGDDGIELAQRISKHRITGDNIILFECNPPQQEVIRKRHRKAVLITDAISDKGGETVEFLQIEGDKNMRGSSSMDLDRINEPWVRKQILLPLKLVGLMKL